MAHTAAHCALLPIDFASEREHLLVGAVAMQEPHAPCPFGLSQFEVNQCEQCAKVPRRRIREGPSTRLPQALIALHEAADSGVGAAASLQRRVALSIARQGPWGSWGSGGRLQGEGAGSGRVTAAATRAHRLLQCKH